MCFHVFSGVCVLGVGSDHSARRAASDPAGPSAGLQRCLPQRHARQAQEGESASGGRRTNSRIGPTRDDPTVGAPAS